MIFSLGAQKAGTSSIFHYLKHHPCLNPSIVKETNFFIKNKMYSRGAEWYITKYFGGSLGPGNMEATPAYLYFPYVAHRIHCTFPESRFIICLRDPVDRAYSAYNMFKQRVTAKNIDFKKRMIQFHYRLGNDDEREIIREMLSYEDAFPSFEALADDELRNPLSARDSLGTRILRMGRYAEQIGAYMSHFSPSSFFIFEMKEMKNISRTLHDLQIFLGIPPMLDLEHKPTVTNKREYSEALGESLKNLLIEYYRNQNDELFTLLRKQYDWKS